VVFAEGDDVEARDGAGKTLGGTGFAEGFDLVDAVEIFGHAEAHDLGRGPEHVGEGVDIVVDQSRFVHGVEGGEFGYGRGIVDGHVWPLVSERELEEFARREDVFGDVRGDGGHGEVDDLGETEIHGDAAEHVGGFGGELPVLDKEIDHAGGSGAGGVEGVGCGLDDGPGADVLFGGPWSGFDEWTGERAVLVQREAEGGVGGAFDAIDADFAIALSGVGVAGGEESGWVEDGQVEGGSGAEIADVHVAAERAGWAGAEFAGLGGGDAHDAAEGAQRQDGGEEGAGDVGFELPVEEGGLGEALREEAETADDAGPAPALVLDVEDVDLEGVAWGGTVDRDGAGERVDAGAVDAEEVGDGGVRIDLGSAGVEALHVHRVAGGDLKARREVAAPEGVGRVGRERVVGHVVSS